jgi:pseudaminic acid synthase
MMENRSFSIGDKEIGLDKPTFIIGELSANHNQKYELAVETIKAMVEAGVDAIKLQTYTPETITIDSNKPDFQITQGTLWDGQTLFSLYKTAYTPWKWQPKLKQVADKLGVPLFSSPFDNTAVDFLEEMGVPAYKVASFEITDIPLIKYMASKGKPMIMSTGVAMVEDIKLAVQACKDVGNEQIVLLKCTSEYPTPMEDVNLRTVVDMQKRFGTIVGVSDHTMGITVPIAAVALGAKVIEKHVILDKSLGGPDSQFSLEPGELKELISSIRDAEKALGKVTYDLTPKALRSREFARSLYVIHDVKKGERVTEENVLSKRPSYGMHPKYYEEMLGKTFTQDVEKGTRFEGKLVDDSKHYDTGNNPR